MWCRSRISFASHSTHQFNEGALGGTRRNEQSRAAALSPAILLTLQNCLSPLWVMTERVSDLNFASRLAAFRGFSVILRTHTSVIYDSLHTAFELSRRCSVALFLTRGASVMSNASFSANTFIPEESASPMKARRPGFFQGFLQALHHSRRLQAERTLQQYRHLIDQGRHRFDRLNIEGRDNGAQ